MLVPRGGSAREGGDSALHIRTQGGAGRGHGERVAILPCTDFANRLPVFKSALYLVFWGGILLPPSPELFRRKSSPFFLIFLFAGT